MNLAEVSQMPMQISGTNLLIAVAICAASIALVTDLRFRRIPNWVTGSALVLGLVGNLIFAGLSGGISALEGIALGLAVLLPFYIFRTMGAGDVKLLAAFGALLGPQAVLAVAVYGSIVGGVQSLVILARLGRVRLTLHQLVFMRVLPASSGATAPYAVALSAGLCLALLHPLGLSW
jgi:prepilin peptidase CpaA